MTKSFLYYSASLNRDLDIEFDIWAYEDGSYPENIRIYDNNVLLDESSLTKEERTDINEEAQQIADEYAQDAYMNRLYNLAEDMYE